MCITVKQMMQIEENGHQMGFLRKFMMENAGAAATKRLVEKFGDVKSKNVLVFAGLGNNGGDALVMARHLAGHGAEVKVLLLGCPENIKTEESKLNWSILENMIEMRNHHKLSSVHIMSLTKLEADLKGWRDDVSHPAPDPKGWRDLPDYLGDVEHEPDIIVDGILGTGITGEIREPFSKAINRFNDSFTCFKFAVDVPSGLDPQTGETSNICTKCDMTVTFHRMKVGMPKRKDVCGEIFVEKIGIPPEAEIGVL